MSYNVSFVPCEIVQRGINEAWTDPTKWQGSNDFIPHAEFLTSRENRRGITAEMVTQTGTIRQVRIVYNQRYLESEVGQNIDVANCDPGPRRFNNDSLYEIDLEENFVIKDTINLKDLPPLCDPSAEVQRKINLMVDVLDRRVATYLALASVSQTGGWSNLIPGPSNEPGNVNGINQYVWKYRKANGDIDPEALGDLKNAMTDSGFPSDSPIFGGSSGRRFFQALQIGCCQDSGLNIGDAMRKFGFSYSYDKRVETALGTAGTNEMLVLTPGAQQVINYSWADLFGSVPWFNEADSKSFKIDRVNSPRLGNTKYDLVRSMNCNGWALTLQLSWTGKLIALPTDLFQSGDELYGVRGAAQVLITNPATV